MRGSGWLHGRTGAEPARIAALPGGCPWRQHTLDGPALRRQRAGFAFFLEGGAPAGLTIRPGAAARIARAGFPDLGQRPILALTRDAVQPGHAGRRRLAPSARRRERQALPLDAKPLAGEVTTVFLGPRERREVVGGDLAPRASRSGRRADSFPPRRHALAEEAVQTLDRGATAGPGLQLAMGDIEAGVRRPGHERRDPVAALELLRGLRRAPVDLCGIEGDGPPPKRSAQLLGANPRQTGERLSAAFLLARGRESVKGIAEALREGVGFRAGPPRRLLAGRRAESISPTRRRHQRKEHGHAEGRSMGEVVHRALLMPEPGGGRKRRTSGDPGYSYYASGSLRGLKDRPWKPVQDTTVWPLSRAAVGGPVARVAVFGHHRPTPVRVHLRNA